MGWNISFMNKFKELSHAELMMELDEYFILRASYFNTFIFMFPYSDLKSFLKEYLKSLHSFLSVESSYDLLLVEAASRNIECVNELLDKQRLKTLTMIEKQIEGLYGSKLSSRMVAELLFYYINSCQITKREALTVFQLEYEISNLYTMFHKMLTS